MCLNKPAHWVHDLQHLVLLVFLLLEVLLQLLLLLQHVMRALDLQDRHPRSSISPRLPFCNAPMVHVTRLPKLFTAVGAHFVSASKKEEGKTLQSAPEHHVLVQQRSSQTQ